MTEAPEIEIVWPGKYDARGRRRVTPRLPVVPLKLVERHQGASRGDDQDREWRNLLIESDNLLAMEALLPGFENRIDLIYIDPPFGTGSSFQVASRIGDRGRRASTHANGARAYRDWWPGGAGGYLDFLAHRLPRMRDLLAPTGNLVVHVDCRMGHLVRLLLDEVFGPRRLVNEVIWYYRSGGGSRTRFGRKHDTLLIYSKTARHYFDADAPEARVPHDAVIPRKWAHKFDPRGKIRPDVWDVGRPPNHSKEWLGFPTQKPEALLRIPVSVLCPAGGLVADFFCGSGTTLVAAEALGRRWIGCDAGRWAIHVARKRLLSRPRRHSFDILSPGVHERRVWAGRRFAPARGNTRDEAASSGETGAGDGTADPYAAWMLHQYGARPMSGRGPAFGTRGEAAVYVAPVDRPMSQTTLGEAILAAAERRKRILHVLTWDPGAALSDATRRSAGSLGVDVRFVDVPRETMDPHVARTGCARFLPRPTLRVRVDPAGARAVRVCLEDFVVDDQNRVPPAVRASVENWSDHIDYWAVDFAFDGTVFAPSWMAIRTRARPALPLESAPHVYAGPGVKVIRVAAYDVAGMTTIATLRVTV